MLGSLFHILYEKHICLVDDHLFNFMLNIEFPRSEEFQNLILFLEFWLI